MKTPEYLEPVLIEEKGIWTPAIFIQQDFITDPCKTKPLKIFQVKEGKLTHWVLKIKKHN